VDPSGEVWERTNDNSLLSRKHVIDRAFIERVVRYGVKKAGNHHNKNGLNGQRLKLYA
jgi:hypothetical protein